MLFSKVTKNGYGYLKDKVRVEAIKTVLLLLIPATFIIVSKVLGGTKGKWLMFIAVMCLIPAGNELVSLIMACKGKNKGCDISLYNRIIKINENEAVPVLYDLYFTSYEKNYPVQALVCVNKGIVGYSNQENFDHKKFEEHINTMLSQNKLSAASIKIFDNEDKFVERVEMLGKVPKTAEDVDNSILRLMMNLTI